MQKKIEIEEYYEKLNNRYNDDTTEEDDEETEEYDEETEEYDEEIEIMEDCNQKLQEFYDMEINDKIEELGDQLTYLEQQLKNLDEYHNNIIDGVEYNREWRKHDFIMLSDEKLERGHLYDENYDINDNKIITDDDKLVIIPYSDVSNYPYKKWSYEFEISNDARLCIDNQDNRLIMKTNKLYITRSIKTIEIIDDIIKTDIDIVMNNEHITELMYHKLIDYIESSPVSNMMRNRYYLKLLNYDVKTIKYIPVSRRNKYINFLISVYHPTPAKYIDTYTQQICRIFFKRGFDIDMNNLDFEITNDFAEKCCEFNPEYYKYLPEHVKTKKLTIVFLNKFPKLINYVPRRLHHDINILLRIAKYKKEVLLSYPYEDLSFYEKLAIVNQDNHNIFYIPRYLVNKAIVKYTFVRNVDNIEFIKKLFSYFTPDYISESIINNFIQINPENISIVPDEYLSYHIVKKILIENDELLKLNNYGTNLKKIFRDNIKSLITFSPNLFYKVYINSDYRCTVFKTYNNLIDCATISFSYEPTIIQKLNINDEYLFTINNKLRYCKYGVPFTMLFKLKDELTDEILIELISSRKNAFNEIPEYLLNEKLLSYALYYHKLNISSLPPHFVNHKLFKYELELNKMKNEKIYEGYGTKIIKSTDTITDTTNNKFLNIEPDILISDDINDVNDDILDIVLDSIFME